MARTSSKDEAREHPRRTRTGTGAGRDPHDKQIEDEPLHQLEAVKCPLPAAVGQLLDLAESESAPVDVHSDTALSRAGADAAAGAGA